MTSEFKELDPNGLAQHAAGAKLDAGKPQAGLVLAGFSQALMAVSELGTIGARKYSPMGWAKVSNGVGRYTDAMMRHWLKECSGETHDAETGVLHATAVAWNALARLHFILESKRHADAEKPRHEPTLPPPSIRGYPLFPEVRSVADMLKKP